MMESSWICGRLEILRELDNHLPTKVVTAPNLSTFKTKFDTFYKNIKFDL